MSRIYLTALAAATASLALVAPAQAAFGLNGFDVRFENEDGSPATEAGSHPFALTTTFHVNFHGEGGEATPDGEMKNLEVALPVGFAGNPTAVPTCSRADFRGISPGTGTSACPDDTAVGHVVAEIVGPSEEPGKGAFAPVFNLKPPKGVAAELGFVVAREPVTIDVVLRKGQPYNVSAAIVNTPQVVKFFGSELTVWGNPASPVHDSERGSCLFVGGSCPVGPGVEDKPFLTLPRACAPPLAATYATTSWQEPTAPPVVGESATKLELTGCESLGFDPQMSDSPTTTAPESPAGLDFDLDISDPGVSESEGIADSDVKAVRVTLPQGITTNPSVASGLAACTLAQYESETLDSAPGTGCPQAAKVGSVEVETPLLENTVLPGSIYVAKQHDNPFDNLLSIYMVIKEPTLGILVRLAGRVEPDPQTGQLTTTFEELPQLPFSHFHLHFREGQRAPLITPATCGTYTSEAVLYPYGGNGQPVTRTASFDVGSPCETTAGALPHAPGFSAGTLDRLAGTYSPFVLRLGRPDGSQQLSQISTTLPEGLLGKIAGVPYCPESGIAQAAARSGEAEGALELAQPSCPAASQVGTVTVGAGAGSEPYYVTGRAYLAGPYKGAPLSLEIVTPAIAGPFDLGVVAVRTALNVDLLTSQISAVSDPIPTILHGLPLDVRSIAIDMSRPDFTLNPTSCEAKSVLGSAISTLGLAAPLDQYFQVSGCDSLAFKPKLTLALKGETERSGHPALKAVLTYPRKGAYSNVARAQVGLPHSEFLDQGNLDNVCVQADLKAGTCPASSVYGKAKAWSPLLDKPLEGPVYLGVGYGHQLPDLVADLNGQLRILLHGKVDTTKQDGLRNTFEVVPDAPVSRFVLEMKGGKKYGLLSNSENICAKPQKASARFVAQNGKVAQLHPTIVNSCKKRENQSKG
jgi:hypothetical protein